MVGNFAQLMVLWTAGAAGAVWFFQHFTGMEPYLLSAFELACSVGLGVMFFTYFNIDKGIPLARKIPYLSHVKHWVKDIKVLRDFTRTELAEILAWAWLRYAIYATQYYFLLRFFDIGADAVSAFFCIGAIFLLQTSVPLPPIIGLMARGNVAIHVWSLFGANEINILAATFGLWIINLILPALCGAFFIFSINISKSLGYENGD